MLSEKPWKPEAVLRLFTGVFLCVFAGVILMSAAHPAKPADNISIGRVVFGALSFQGAALVLICFFLRRHRTRWKEAFGFANDWKHALLFGMVGGIIFFPIGRGVQWVSMELMTRFNGPPAEQAAVKALSLVTNWSERMTLIVVTIVLAPIAEEMLFRGILYPMIKQLGFPRLAWWGVSALFAAIHFNLAIFPPLFVLALLLTLLYERTNNLLAPIVTHSLFNAANFALFYLVYKSPAKL
jgi:membrane protease YdiL (CAAX protease family)